ncbi:metalloregulator ArsR/SmtB family transcription factor [Glycomyces sp. NRRL B-16210]|uniref:ArsR/SmtB family transcription factor n=1 Tax=Glycomyces sp. NRRL B-16210 TaxID=1463821 RepID=UPI0004BFD97E|nr:metalloregulator ArsR/SmtB family transcription factor [Glycomyces sp. NRRL B-16210]
MPDRQEQAPAPQLHHAAPSTEQFATAAAVFALLADQTRLQLLWALAEGEADVTALAAATEAARPAVSQHLAKLRLAGLVNSRREGRRVVYSMTDGHLRRLVLEALSRADHQVTGEPWHA